MNESLIRSKDVGIEYHTQKPANERQLHALMQWSLIDHQVFPFLSADRRESNINAEGGAHIEVIGFQCAVFPEYKI